jgi:NlpC/P60 family putative phage cell wall peptidase
MTQALRHEQLERNEVIAEAHRWVGTPFKHDAEVLGVGVDCAHLINAVYTAAKRMTHIKFPHYAPDWWKHAEDPEQHIIENAKLHFKEITAAQAKPGDWVVLFIGRAWAHCAIIVGNHQVIEAWPTRALVSLVNSREERLYRTHQKRYFTCW